MLWETKDNWQFIITLGGRDRVHYPGHTLIPVISLPRARGEDPILKEERLISGKTLFEEVSLPSFVMPAEAVLMKDVIKFSFSLRSNIIV